ncbi:epidermal growth factor-like protein 7 isoform X2 [Elephas maximus indicus]|uniref:epidermal growth factor-like protein 7 isoform X2 n=1 Tax=Elephas maximus indicus TaxID=99487 RepID=UPI002116FCF9|nr:epidermal growth factor-like protein 7 isoform X2 [Elephas maximus indicus]
MGARAHGLGGRARHAGPMLHRGSGATPAQQGSGGQGQAWARAASAPTLVKAWAAFTAGRLVGCQAPGHEGFPHTRNPHPATLAPTERKAAPVPSPRFRPDPEWLSCEPLDSSEPSMGMSHPPNAESALKTCAAYNGTGWLAPAGGPGPAPDPRWNPQPPWRGNPHSADEKTGSEGPGHPEEKTGPPARWPCGAPGSWSCCGSWCWPPVVWTTSVAQTTSTSLAEECVQTGLPGVRSPSPLCSGCTSPSLQSAMDTGPAAPTGPSTGLPTAAAPGQPRLDHATSAVPAGRGPTGSPGPVEQYASHRARMEGAVSGQADATVLPGGRGIPVRQMWMNAAGDEAAVPSTVSTLQAATGASVRRGTACLQTGHSACP